MTNLVVQDLFVIAGQTLLVENVSFSLKPGELVVLLGPNGAGKTSLLRAAIGLEKLASGSSKINNLECHSLSPLQRAKQIAYLPQQRPLAWPNTVRDVVALGRYAFGAAPRRLSHDDTQIVQSAMESCDIVHLSERKTDTLSGGELARVHCARAFASNTPLLIADEPVAALDPKHQFRILDIFKSYVESGGGALIVLHDITLAARYADRLIWMKHGRILADGPPADTLNAERLAEIYGIKANINGTNIDIEGAI